MQKAWLGFARPLLSLNDAQMRGYLNKFSKTLHDLELQISYPLPNPCVIKVWNFLKLFQVLSDFFRNFPHPSNAHSPRFFIRLQSKTSSMEWHFFKFVLGYFRFFKDFFPHPSNA